MAQAADPSGAGSLLLGSVAGEGWEQRCSGTAERGCEGRPVSSALPQ